MRAGTDDPNTINDVRQAYVIRVNIHNQGWNGTVCTNPLQHRDCFAREEFKSAHCSLGEPRCFFLSLFHPTAPLLRLDKGIAAHGAVFDYQPPRPGDLFLFWGSYVDHRRFLVGAWELESFDDTSHEWHYILRGRPESTIRLLPRTTPLEAVLSRLSRAAGGEAARLLAADELPVVVDLLLGDAREELGRLHGVGLNTDEARAAVAGLERLRGSLPEPQSYGRFERTGGLTQRIVIPSLDFVPSQPAVTDTPAHRSEATAVAATDNGHGHDREANSNPAAAVPVTVEAAPLTRRRDIDRFPGDLVHDYAVALEVSPLVLLAGPSGSGKTFLTRSYADSIDAEYRLIAVRPDWRANEDLLGYLPALGGDFIPTSFSLFVAEAALEHEQAQREGRPARRFHVCLDEMNLARPEYYMAEVLSKMELSGPDRRLRLYDAREDRGFPREIALPPNLSIIGTVNNDDTTHPFSPKVLDRAVYLVCDHIDLRGWFASRPAEVAELGEVLIELDGILLQTGSRVGYRVAEQVESWVREASLRGQDQLAALDAAVCTLILAKMRLLRSDPAHAEALDALQRYLSRLGGIDTEGMPRSLATVERLAGTLARREVAFGQLET